MSSISWQQYFAAIAIISVTYYLYVLLRYYQREISNLFTSKQQSAVMSQGGSISPTELMGAARPDKHVRIVEEQELQFADEELNESLDSTGDLTDSNNNITIPEAQLIGETDNLIAAFKDVDNKSEFLSLLKILIGSFQPYQAEIDFSKVTTHVISQSAENLLFDLTADELPKWN
ncbi:hypothetical protein FPZ43_17975 [Mucilaginibacter pallidiroseus]|uniref:Uncharacterized protein n=1 Tax=Mucilaginibacter pallidiroseus TaxID=2599295 RepID=A0A563TZH8_9SPHI|nr:hypothetical protein [Mucilaginibacter pallidiroseus]TWR24784.1 hypothetical protein FPZ43_17975 [Mucilaginibacter pallidiroseus]